MYRSTFCVLAVLLFMCHACQSFLINGRAYKEKISSRDSAANDDEEANARDVKHWLHEMMAKRSQPQHQARRSAANGPASSASRSRNERQIPAATVSQSVSVQCNVEALAIRRDQLYVSYFQLDTGIDVYNTTVAGGAAFRLERHLDFTGLRSINDMASCPDCDVVYVSDPHRNQILLIDDNGLRTQWSTGRDQPLGLSVDAEKNVVAIVSVTASAGQRVRVYSPTGDLVREIGIQSGIRGLTHAVQTGANSYIVAHADWNKDKHVVCALDRWGAETRCYGGSGGSGTGHLSLPSRLAISGRSLLVADYNNRTAS